jgi:hypothetical protein
MESGTILSSAPSADGVLNRIWHSATKSCQAWVSGAKALRTSSVIARSVRGGSGRSVTELDDCEWTSIFRQHSAVENFRRDRQLKPVSGYCHQPCSLLWRRGFIRDLQRIDSELSTLFFGFHKARPATGLELRRSPVGSGNSAIPQPPTWLGKILPPEPQYKYADCLIAFDLCSPQLFALFSNHNKRGLAKWRRRKFTK